MKKVPGIQCAACRSYHSNRRSVLCPKCSKRFNAGERVQCDGFALQKKRKKVSR